MLPTLFDVAGLDFRVSGYADFAFSVAGDGDVISFPKFEVVDLIGVQADDVAVAGFPNCLETDIKFSFGFGCFGGKCRGF